MRSLYRIAAVCSLAIVATLPVALYAFVGAQMGWMLRPFIGSPELQFILFRGKGGSLVESVIHHLRQII